MYRTFFYTWTRRSVGGSHLAGDSTLKGHSLPIRFPPSPSFVCYPGMETCGHLQLYIPTYYGLFKRTVLDRKSSIHFLGINVLASSLLGAKRRQDTTDTRSLLLSSSGSSTCRLLACSSLLRDGFLRIILISRALPTQCSERHINKLFLTVRLPQVE